MENMLIPAELVNRHSPQEAADRSKAAAQIGAAWAGRFERLAGLKATDRVLDIGCGPGRMAIAIGERYGWTNPYFGFDIFKEDIEFASGHVTTEHPGFEFGHLDLRNELYNPEGKIDAGRLRFPAEDHAFDFAFATSIFTHFFEADTGNYVRETFRTLAPGGTFLATFFLIPPGYDEEPHRPAARFRLVHKVAPHIRVLYPENPGKAVGFDLEYIKTLFADIGFVDFKVLPGGWSGTTGAASSQDIVIARKPRVDAASA